MYSRIVICVLALTIPTAAFAKECKQENLKGRWQFDLVRVGGEAGLGMRCTFFIDKTGKIKTGNQVTECSYTLENTPKTSGTVTLTDTPTACVADIDLKIAGAASGRKAFLKTSLRMSVDLDYADRYDALLQDQDNVEIFSGPVSFYKY